MARFKTFTLRIDDVNPNTSADNLQAIMDVFTQWATSNEYAYKILLACSPFAHDMSDADNPQHRERVFPPELSAMSDHRLFYCVDLMGTLFEKGKWYPHHIRLASHGLVHVDHRLLGREAQELSILTSCSVIGTRVFVPPFNKWNKDTADVCREHDIELVRFEDGWRHVGHNKFDPAQEKFYLHTHDVSAEQLEKWLVAA